MLINEYGTPVSSDTFPDRILFNGPGRDTFPAGDSLLFCGVLTVGDLVIPLVGLMIAAAVLGNTVNYTIGHFLVSDCLPDLIPVFFVRITWPNSRLYEKHGAVTVVLTFHSHRTHICTVCCRDEQHVPSPP